MQEECDAKLELLFQNEIENFSIYSNRVAIAVSGGMDSVALLHLTINWTKKKKFLLPVVLTVNHALRPESLKEAKFAVDYAKKLGIKESFILSWKKQNIKGNIQSQARNARYNLLTNWCKVNNVKYLLIAHHKNDQAETFLIRLERGSGIDGLSSMDHKSVFNGIFIVRPLLNFSHSEIKKYVNFYHLKWIEDKSNQDPRYRRTLYRKLLKTSNDQKTLINRICLAAIHAKRALKALMHYTRISFNNCVNIHDLGYIEIKLNNLLKLPEEIALRILLYSIMAISNKHYKPRYNKLITIFNMILQNININCTLSACKIKKHKKSILIIKEPSKIQEISINLPLNNPIKWDNRFNCEIICNEKCLVSIAPLKKICKIPTSLKEYNCYSEVFYSLPVVLKDKKILAYPCINYNKENDNSKFQCIITNSIIKQNLINLTDI